MSVNEKLMVTVNVAGDISNFQSSIKTIQTELGKLQLPNNLKEGFSQIFNSLNREIEKVQGIAGKKKIDLVDQKQLQKSFSTIENYYNRLVNKMQSSKIKTSLFAKDEKVLSQINNLLTTYNNKVNANAATQKKLNKELEAAQKAYNKINEKPQNSDEVKQVTEHTKALKEQLESAKALEKVKAAALAEKQADPNVKVIKATKAYKEHEAAVQAVQQAQQAYNAAKAAEPQLKTEAEAVALQRVEETLLNAQKAVNDFNANQSQIETTAWEKLKTDLQAIEGINWKEIGIDPSSIKNAEDLEVALEKIREVAGSSTGGVFGKLRQESQAAAKNLQGMQEKALQTGQALQDLGDRQRDIQQLASRLTHFFSLTNQFMIMRRIIQNAVTTIKELDKAMTETAVVTDFNVADMWAQLPEYTKVANELGATTKGAYETMTLFYQQGLNQQQAFQLGTETMKMARIAGLDYAEATDRMTNALRGFNMELNDVSSQRVNDVYSNLAAKSASNVDELSTAMTKTASIAHAANMEFETTAAFLAQIIETTRESAETAGTALKTVIARFSEVKKLYSEGELTGQDEEGEQIDVNRVSTALRAAGVDLNEYLTGAKGLDEVFIELASKWDNLDLVTQRYIATMAAGSRQQSRFIALMQDYSRQTELVSIAENAAGASQQQFQKTLDSLEAKLNKLSNAWNEFTMGIANSSLIKGAIDLITGLITAINKVTAALGPVGGAITKVLLLFAGFKGVRALFDKFIGYIAKTYVNAARAASAGGAAAGAAYAKSYTAAATGGMTTAFGKIQQLFQKSTWVTPTIDVEKITAAKTAVDALNTSQALYNATSMESVGVQQLKDAWTQVGITGDGLQNALIEEKIGLNEIYIASLDEEAFNELAVALAKKQDINMTATQIKWQLKDALATRTNANSKIGLITTLKNLRIALFATNAEERQSALAHVATALKIDTESAAYLRLKAAMEALPLGWIIVAIGAAVAVTTMLVKAAQELSLDGKLEDAANLANSLDEELKEVQKTLDEFDEHTSSIETLKDELSELTTGTQEWKNKVQELNGEYIELSKIIGSDFWQNATIENGVINVSDDYLKKVQQDLIDRQAKIQQQQIQTSAITTDLNFQKTGESFVYKNIDAFQGNFTPGFSFTESIKNLSTEDIADFMGASDMEAFNKKAREVFDGLKFKGDDVKQAQAELQNYINEVNSATAQIDASFELMASDLQDTTINKGAYGKVFASIQGQNLKAIEDIGAEVDANLFMAPQTLAYALDKKAAELDLDMPNFNNMEEVFDEYIRIMNEAYGEGTYKREGWDIKKINDEGSYEKIDIGAGEIAQRILTEWANEQDFEAAYKEKINELQTALSTTAAAGTDQSVLEALIAGDYTQEDIENLSKEAIDAINTALQDEELGLNIKLDDTFVKEGVGGMIADLQKQLNNANLSFNAESLFKATTSKGQSAFLDLFNGSITGNKSKFADLFMGLDDFTDAEEFASIMEHLGSIDFSNKADWEALPKWLEDAGIEIPDDALQTFINKCEELAHAIDKVDFTKIEEQLGTLYSSLDKLRSGDIDATAIDEDTYNSLLESGVVSAEDFRKNLATGEYVYIEGQDSLETAIYAAIQALDKNAEAQLEANVKANEVLENINNEEQLQDLKSKLQSDNTNLQRGAIAETFNAWKNNGVDIDSLGIEGLNNDTIISQLNSDQAADIAAAISTIILNGVEGAKAQQEAYQSNTDYTEAAVKAEDRGYSYEQNGDVIETATQSIDNFEAKLATTKEELKGMEGVGDKAFKGLTIDIDKSLKAAEGFRKTMEDNVDALKDMSNPKFDGALKDLTSSMQEIFGDSIDSKFVKENLDDIIDYYETGSEEAAYRIREAFASSENFLLDVGVNPDSITAIQDEIGSLINDIDGYQAEIDVNGYADVSDIINKLVAAGATAEQALQIAEQFTGFQITPSTEWVTRAVTVWETHNTNAGMKAVPVTKEVKVPKISYATNKGGAFTGGKSGGGGTKRGSGGGGGGGGGGSNKEPEDNRDWKNPYDKLYNAYAKLEELQRKRNNLEKEYNLLVDTAAGSVQDTNKYLAKQLKNLQDQAKTQESIVSGKRTQIQQAQSKTYEVEDGVVKSYAKAFKDAIDESNKTHKTGFSNDLSTYAKYNTSTEQMEIDWNQIQSLEGKIDSAAGEVLEAYISELEGLEDQFEEAQDALLDIKAEIKAIVDQAMEDRIAYVDAMREAMISQYQKQIDKLSALNDAINESNQRIFDSLQQQIDLERQIRDNTKTEDEIAQNEARLAYLQRDTSGANDLEIQKLQQTLADQRENYSDTLVDQELARLQDQADEAAEQREHQIELMEAQLQFWQDTGYFEELIDKGISEGKAMEIYKDYTDYANKTRAEQAKIMQDFYGLFNKGGSANTAALAAADAQYNGGKYKVKDSKGNTYDVSYDAGTGTWKGKDINGKAFSLTTEQITSADTNKKILSTSVSLSDKAATSGSGGGGGGGTPAKTQNTSTSTTNAPSYPYGKASDTSGNIKQGAKGQAVKAIQYALNKLGYGNSGTKSLDGVFGSGTKSAVKAFQKAMGISADGIVGKNTRAKFKAKGYITGGLADYTGPAWLDGTPSKPELVLNAKDTENFIQLKNILADVAKDSKSGSSGGDNYFDIKVEVGEIGSDYDVEKMITKIKDEIDQDARYRNVNSINFIR